jgi:hypothetical protein
MSAGSILQETSARPPLFLLPSKLSASTEPCTEQGTAAHPSLPGIEESSHAYRSEDGGILNRVKWYIASYVEGKHHKQRLGSVWHVQQARCLAVKVVTNYHAVTAVLWSGEYLLYHCRKKFIQAVRWHSSARWRLRSSPSGGREASEERLPTSSGGGRPRERRQHAAYEKVLPQVHGRSHLRNAT